VNVKNRAHLIATALLYIETELFNMISNAFSYVYEVCSVSANN
jgi:hypothetical protein